MGETNNRLPQAKIADALEGIVSAIDPEGSDGIEGYKLPQKRIAFILDRLAKKIDQDGGIYAKVPTHICTSGEYSVITGEPNIENPEKDTFYLVPNGTSGDDMFDEWIWDGEHWERFGSGGALATALAGLSDVQIANLEDGQSLIYDAATGKWINGTVTAGTTYTFAEGDVDGAFSVTPEGGSAQTVSVHGLRSICFGDDSSPIILDGGCLDDD